MGEKKNIRRESYMARVLPFIDKNIIKVFIGQRRVGKSYVMEQVANVIRENNPKANIIYVDKEKFEFSNIQTSSDLYNYVVERLTTESNYLFVDEVQEISEFELALRSLLNEANCDIYCSGSNANMLSGDLATHLSARYISININSLSYREYLLFNQTKSSTESLKDYLKYGGMPFIYQLPKNDDVIAEYLKSIYSTILLKDLVSRYKVKNISFLERLIQYLADNVGSTFSAKNICDYLKSQKIDMTVPTVQNYLNALCSSFLIHRVQRLNLQGLKIFEIGEKYYFEDFGIRNVLTNVNPSLDINKVIENVVFKELLSRNYKVFVGRLKDKEIDFVAENHEGKIYVQVCYLLSSDKTIDREFGNLASINDNYPKYVVSMDEFPCADKYPGIHQVHLRDFLLMDKYI